MPWSRLHNYQMTRRIGEQQQNSREPRSGKPLHPNLIIQSIIFRRLFHWASHSRPANNNRQTESWFARELAEPFSLLLQLDALGKLRPATCGKRSHGRPSTEKERLSISKTQTIRVLLLVKFQTLLV